VDDLMRRIHCCLAILGLTSGTAFGHFTFEVTDQHLLLREGEIPILVFNSGLVKPQGNGTPRSGYIHPLFGSDGSILTDDFPADHPHHRGLFFAWPGMTVLGTAVDAWHMKGIQPDFAEWGPRQVNEREASFEAVNLWRLTGEEERPAVREHLRYTIHQGEQTGRMIDVHATFTNLTDQEIVLRGSPRSAYGGLNIRMDGKRPDVRIATARGPLQKDANAIDPPSPWADHSSRPAGEEGHSGVAIFQHPENPGFPARNWTLRFYGFLGAAWPGEESHIMAPGASLALRYRLFIHHGDAEAAGVAARFQAYLKSSQNSQSD
jgi:hypothetical protein